MAKAKKYNEHFHAQVKEKPKVRSMKEISKNLGVAPKKPRKRSKYAD